MLSDEDFIRLTQEGSPQVVGVMHPDWRGIRRSLESHIDHCYYLEDIVSPDNVDYYCDLLNQTGCKKIVYGGLPLSYAFLIRRMKILYPDVDQYINWQGSFMQSNEDYNWDSFKGVLCLQKEGAIQKIGVGKKGMEAPIRKLGVNCVFYSNFIRAIPDAPSTPLDNGPHLGIWAISSIWRKNPFAMLAATATVEHASVHLRGYSHRVDEFTSLFGINCECGDAVEMSEMASELAKMHVNLYVTLSECAPLTPLESLSVGVPCLFGPNSHYFQDWEKLFEQLVVPFPDRSDVIASYIENALENRSDIITEYAKFARQYNPKAKQEFAEFIDL